MASARPPLPAAIALLLLFCWMSPGFAAAQNPQPPDPAPGETAEPAEAADADSDAVGNRGGRRNPNGIKPYDEVITEDTDSDAGVFTVHRLDDKVFYEIPEAELGKEFLWVSQIARTTEGVGYGGQALGNRVVKWERRGDRVLLKSVSYALVADAEHPIARAVEAANNDTIIRAFDIEALSEDGAPVIDVTRLFNREVPEFSARSRLQARGFARDRSFVESVTAFPENIEVRTTHTYTLPPPSAGQNRARTPFRRRGMRPGSATVLLHYSMVKLPEEPMQPRLFDERVGYFSVRQIDYGRDEHRAPRRRYITRWRLEKRNPEAAVSDPVKPITYWIDPATPAKWVPYIRQGVEAWQPAFEAAGFSNAVVAREAPTPDEDPDWSAEDARNSVIRWLPSTVENASGPHVHDPRTGEILEADIQFHHNVMNLVRDWYFIQVGPLDPRARTLPLPDELMGDLLAYVAAHEVGHTLGFQHNMKASSLYPPEKVRDPDWVRTMSHTPTLMDYSRFNYVAQPEDGIAVEDLIPKIGPYDVWATKWGYAPIPDAASPDDEKSTLDAWAREQDDTPWYRFSTPGAQSADPGQLTEAVGDADAVESTALGLKNLKRVASMLLDATATEAAAGDPYDDLDGLYGRLVGQWALEMNHVAAVVGGVRSQQKHIGQDGVRFTTIPRETQAAALAFLNDHAFTTPMFLIDPSILRRLEPAGALERIRTSQARVLRSLLSSARIRRLVEQEAIDGGAAYAATDFLADLRAGLWAELDSPSVRIDAWRRNVQRVYLDVIDGQLNGRQAAGGDARPFLRGELRALGRTIGAALERSADRATRLHLEDVQDTIARTLDPPAAPSPSGAGRALAGLDEELVHDPFRGWTGDATYEAPACWPDYAVRIALSPADW
ncbi:MAG: zinc-dependent metalloprotease [Acidobacteria bacterium]|nr:zinc-dependent metalloprotease [Acidobacteriota bacterium]